MDFREAEQFRRIQVIAKIERAVDMISGYRVGIDFYRDKINKYYKSLGRIAERLGEKEEEGD